MARWWMAALLVIGVFLAIRTARLAAKQGGPSRAAYYETTLAPLHALPPRSEIHLLCAPRDDQGDHFAWIQYTLTPCRTVLVSGPPPAARGWWLVESDYRGPLPRGTRTALPNHWQWIAATPNPVTDSPADPPEPAQSGPKSHPSPETADPTNQPAGSGR